MAGAVFRFFLNSQGARGKKGDKGDQGYSPSITIKENTPTEFIMTVHNEFDEFDTPNLIPTAFQEKITELDQTTQQHGERLNQAEKEIDALHALANAHTSDLEDLGTRVNNNAKNITILQGNVATNNSLINSTNVQVESLGKRVTTNENSITSLEIKNNAQDGAISNNTEAISNLKDDVDKKQNKLVEGENVTLTDNPDGTTTISAKGGGTGTGDVTAAGDNTFTGKNTFDNTSGIVVKDSSTDRVNITPSGIKGQIALPPVYPLPDEIIIDSYSFTESSIQAAGVDLKVGDFKFHGGSSAGDVTISTTTNDSGAAVTTVDIGKAANTSESAKGLHLKSKVESGMTAFESIISSEGKLTIKGSDVSDNDNGLNIDGDNLTFKKSDGTEIDLLDKGGSTETAYYTNGDGITFTKPNNEETRINVDYKTVPFLTRSNTFNGSNTFDQTVMLTNGAMNGEKEYFLDQSSIEQGENITVEKTEKGVRISSTGGNGDVDLSGVAKLTDNNIFTGLNTFNNLAIFDGVIRANVGIEDNTGNKFLTQDTIEQGDNVNITKTSNGVRIDVTNSGNSEPPANMVTTDTAQVIQADKAIHQSNKLAFGAQTTSGTYIKGNGSYLDYYTPTSNAHRFYGGTGSGTTNCVEIYGNSGLIHKSSGITISGGANTNRGLQINADTLQFTNSSGETTDLLAKSSGEEIDTSNFVTLDTAQVISSDKVIKTGNKLGFGNSTSPNYYLSNSSFALEYHASSGMEHRFFNGSGTSSYYYLDIQGDKGIIHKFDNLTLSASNNNSDNTKGLRITPSGLTFTGDDGKVTDLLAAGSGSDIDTSKFVTTDTEQYITGRKNFENGAIATFTNANMDTYTTIASTNITIMKPYIAGVPSMGNTVFTVNSSGNLQLNDESTGKESFRVWGHKAYFTDSTSAIGTLLDYSSDSVHRLIIGTNNKSGTVSGGIYNSSIGLQLAGSVNSSDGSVRGMISADNGVEIYPNNLMSGANLKVNGNGLTYGTDNGIKANISGSTTTFTIGDLTDTDYQCQISHKGDTTQIKTESEIQFYVGKNKKVVITEDNGGFDVYSGAGTAAVSKTEISGSYIEIGKNNYDENTVTDDSDNLTLWTTTDKDTGTVTGKIGAGGGVEIYPNHGLSGNALKVNKDGLTYADKKVATADNISGDWVAIHNNILSGITLTANQTKEASLSTVLPNDGHNYEAYFQTTFNAGNLVNLYLGTDILTRVIIARGTNDSLCGFVSLPVGLGRTIKVMCDANPPTQAFTVSIVGYRKLGKAL